MRRFTRPLVVGTLAFGLVAAAATGVAFTITSVAAGAGTTTATAVVTSEPCTGTYDVTWTLNAGIVEGMQATRTAEAAPDAGLAFCANAAYAVSVAPDGTTYTQEWTGFTDASGDIDENATLPFSGSFPLDDGAMVKIAIGPDALNQ